MATQAADLRRLRASADTSTEALGHASHLNRATRRALIGGAAAAMTTLAMLGGQRPVHAEPPTPLPPPNPEPPASTTRTTGGNFVLGVTTNNVTAVSDLTGLQNALSFRQRVNLQVDNNSGGENFGTFNTTTNQIAIVAAAGDTALAGLTHVGVYSYAPNAYGVITQARWPIAITPGTAAPPTTDAAGNAVREGTLYYASNTGVAGGEDLWLFMGNSSWRRIITEYGTGAEAPIGPVRVLDTRPTGGSGITLTGFDGVTDAPITAGLRVPGVYSFRVANHFGIPADVKGIFGTVSLQDVAPGGGFATVFPGGTPPNAATIVPQPVSPFIASTSFYTQTSSPGNFSINTVGLARYLIADVAIIYY